MTAYSPGNSRNNRNVCCHSFRQAFTKRLSQKLREVQVSWKRHFLRHSHMWISNIWNFEKLWELWETPQIIQCLHWGTGSSWLPLGEGWGKGGRLPLHLWHRLTESVNGEDRDWELSENLWALWASSIEYKVGTPHGCRVEVGQESLKISSWGRGTQDPLKCEDKAGWKKFERCLPGSWGLSLCIRQEVPTGKRGRIKKRGKGLYTFRSYNY